MLRTLLILFLLITNCLLDVKSQANEIVQIFSNCHKSQRREFDPCIKKAFNDLRPYFKSGVPDLKIAPFDPHQNQYVETRRGDGRGVGGFRLLLTNAFEYGWTNSEVTSYRTDWDNDRIVYSQYFPEKSLEGNYDFTGNVLGKQINTKGNWNLTLYKYSQTTSVTRVGGPGGLLKTRIEIDKIGNLQLHISNLFGGKIIIESLADLIINTLWQPGFPFLKPLINELVSTAFTDIFNESFRYLPLDQIIKD